MHSAKNLRLSWGHRELDFGKRPRVMGILNCTPDSFYPASRLADTEAALDRAMEMVRAGAEILDVGGESTRPGSDPVDAAQEIDRVVPVIRQIRSRCDVLISIDTRKVEVAEKALDAGADLVNDVSALRDNGALARLIAARDVPVVLMQMRGEPKTMQKNPRYDDALAEIASELCASAAFARSCGIRADRIILDPGIGFGKRLQDNLAILRGLSRLCDLGYPVLVGLSRKSFLGMLLEREVEQRLAGTVAAHMIALINGADILRVHDVAEAVDAVRVFEALCLTGQPAGAAKA